MGSGNGGCSAPLATTTARLKCPAAGLSWSRGTATVPHRRRGRISGVTFGSEHAVSTKVGSATWAKLRPCGAEAAINVRAAGNHNCHSDFAGKVALPDFDPRFDDWLTLRLGCSCK